VKSELRKSTLAKRKALTGAEVTEKSYSIFRKWQPLLQPERHRWVHTFISIPEFKEVDTKPFIDHLKSFPQIQIGVPRVDFQTREVTHHPYCDLKLVRNSWGILEPPASSPELKPELFDMVLVPMIAFDRLGHRLGYGGGYYDRFLAKVRPDCLRIGLCFELGFLDSDLPARDHDVSLDGVITESRYHKGPKVH
jgi:5-formyltetrahydrofolate cyclo-ligase